MDWETKAWLIFVGSVAISGILFEQYQRRMMYIGYIFKPRKKRGKK